jgi:Ca2+-binding EF-hand superfamily protein
MSNYKIEELSSNEISKFNQLMVDFYIEKDDSTLEDLFQIYDRTRKGAVTVRELKVVMKAICPEVSNDDGIIFMVEEADKNNNGQIELQEFKEVMIKRRDCKD